MKTIRYPSVSISISKGCVGITADLRVNGETALCTYSRFSMYISSCVGLGHYGCPMSGRTYKQDVTWLIKAIQVMVSHFLGACVS